MRYWIIACLSWLFVLPTSAQTRPMVYAEITVDASVVDVWTDWTSKDGLESFFAPKAIVDLKPGGAYEIWFLPDAPEGQRGAEDGVILGLQTHKMIQYTWAMPPYMPEIRPHMTTVQMFFEPVSDSRTRVQLFHTGFGSGEAWDKGRDYFAKSWPAVMDLYAAHKAPKDMPQTDNK